MTSDDDWAEKVDAVINRMARESIEKFDKQWDERERAKARTKLAKAQKKSSELPNHLGLPPADDIPII